jgi:hypothetical protein
VAHQARAASFLGAVKLNLHFSMAGAALVSIFQTNFSNFISSDCWLVSSPGASVCSACVASSCFAGQYLSGCGGASAGTCTACLAGSYSTSSGKSGSHAAACVESSYSDAMPFELVLNAAITISTSLLFL